MRYEQEQYSLEKELDDLSMHYNDDPQGTLMLILKLLGYKYYDISSLNISEFINMILVGFKNQLMKKKI